MKKTMKLIFTGMLGLSILSGCGTSDSSTGTGDEVEIEFFHYKREATTTFDNLIAKFEKENPNIKIEQTSPPEAETVLKTRVAKRELPDIIGIGANSTFAELSAAGVYQDMTDDELLNKIQPAYVEMLHDVTGLEETYAIPYVANASAVIYNKAIFEELGLEIPKTWEEFIQVAETVKKAGKNPFYLTIKDAWTTLAAFNALSANNQEPDFFRNMVSGEIDIQSEFKDSATKYNQLMDYGHDAQLGTGYADGNTAFAKGESAMYLQGIWAIPEIKKANPDIELGVFPYPVADNPAENKLVSGVDLLFSLSTTTKHPEEAKKFIEFLLEEETAKAYISEQNAFSAIEGIPQEDPTLEGLAASFESGALIDFPDHYIPVGVGVDKLLQVLAEDRNVDQFLNSFETEWKKVQDRK